MKPIPGLDKHAHTGLGLLDVAESVAQAHEDFQTWVTEVHRWLARELPDSGLTAEWATLSKSQLIGDDGEFIDEPGYWIAHRSGINKRLQWLGNLPGVVFVRGLSVPARAQDEAQMLGRREIKLATTSRAYVDPQRIAELQSITSQAFDLQKLIRMCEEVNVCFAGETYFALIMLTRAIIDHVPPIFGCKNFRDVASHAPGAKSFKDSMERLDTSSRKIADACLHVQIRRSETVPTVTQVDFSNDLDVLLGEIARVLR